jgi:signal transduction histidine kinase/ligand-binding sensor domain-containing protein
MVREKLSNRNRNAGGVRWHAIAALLAFCAFPLNARHLPIQRYTSAQGLPQNTVECLLPSPAGLLWLCTAEGLVRFDGYHFRVFGPEDGLPSRHVADMTVARRGGFWVLTDRGLCRLPPGSKVGEPCRLLEADNKAGPFNGGVIFESQTGDTWVSSPIALFRVSADGRRLERSAFRVPSNTVIYAMADGWDGKLFVSTDQALFEWSPGQEARNLTQSMGPVGVLCFYRWAPDEYWLGTTRGFHRLWRKGGAINVKRQPLSGIATDGRVGVNAILRRSDGQVWVAGKGIARIDVGTDGEVVTRELYTIADGLPTIGVSGLVEDAQGNLWGGTEGSGIFRIEESGFTSYSSADGLGNARIAALLEDSHGRLCVIPSWERSPEVLVQDGGRFQAVPIQHPESIHYFGWGWNQWVTAAHDGTWWIPTGAGLLQFPKLARAEDLSHTKPVLFDEHSALGCSEIFRTWEDPQGDIWITCASPQLATVRWEHRTGTFRRWTEADGLPHDSGAVVYRAGPQGTIWIGANSQAIRFRNERFEAFPLAPGRRPAHVRDMLVDSAGRVWVATQYSGVFRCDNPNDAAPLFRDYTVAEGLSTDFVSSLVEDRSGYIYAGTARGVDRIDPRAPIGSRRIRHFTAADGLPESEENTAMRDHRGYLWFGTLAGLAEFDPGKSGRRPAPDIYLTRVRVRGEDVPLPWEGTQKLSLDLASDRNQVEIEYSAVDLASPESLLYQYRLRATDADWSEPLQRLDVNYASLPSGPFRFEVRAVDADGQVSQQTAGFDFTIAVPLWRRWWFLSLMLLVTMAAIAQLYNYRVRQLLAMERLRTRIATDLHDDIGASLTQISILTEVARRSPAPHVLSDVANIARGLVSDMSDIVWAVNPRHDKFEGLVHRMRRFSSDVLGGADIDLAFETGGLPADVPVPLEARRPLYLVVKEAVNNVARHSGASKATIRLELVSGNLKLTVTDDGRGFDPALGHSGEGLLSLARRMKEIGGTATWESQPGWGTRLTAVLPLPGRISLHELMGLPGRVRR